MSLRRRAARAAGWFGTLPGRLTILLLLALIVAQGTTVFYLIGVHQRERAMEQDRAFFANLARIATSLDAMPPGDRDRYLRSMNIGVMAYWISPGPILPNHARAPGRDSPPAPEAWNMIDSTDKRIAWYEDARPFAMRYRVYDPPPPVSQRVDPADGRMGDPPDDFAGSDRADIDPADDDFDGARAVMAPGRAFPPGLDAAKPRPPGGPRGEGPRAERPRAEGPRAEGPGAMGPGPAGQPGAAGLGPPVGPPGGYGGNPAYGEAAARRPTATMGSPPTRWRTSLLLTDGTWLSAEFYQMAGLPIWTEVLFEQSFVTLVVMGVMIIAGVGLTTKRLSVLAKAADRVGRGDTLEPIPESGTSEVRGLTQAFNTMSLRLRRFIEGRTQMLGAISHDLRTPITGLRLRAELVDDDENRERMLAIIDELHHLTEATLALAREDSIMERSDRVDVSALVENICDDLTDVGMDVSCTVERGVTVTCRPFSLRRAIRNLAENGVKYGQRSRLTLTASDRHVAITIDDDGPGIPQEQLEKALLPFVRLEGSRSRETGGAGLGLAITRSIVLNHGGELKLSNRPEGGLRAEILLPRDA